MPAWSNTDAPNAKPKWDVERQTREVIQLPVLTGNTPGNNIIVVSYNDGAQNNVANIGVVAGQYVYFWANGANTYGGQAGNGVPGMFFSNTTVSSTSGNTVTLTNNLFNTVSAGFTVEFDKTIPYSSSKPNMGGGAYNANTVLVTDTRGMTANQAVSLGNLNAGWVNIIKTTNNDGTVRYRHETLVVLANPTASNVYSGNTGWGSPFVPGV